MAIMKNSEYSNWKEGIRMIILGSQTGVHFYCLIISEMTLDINTKNIKWNANSLDDDTVVERLESLTDFVKVLNIRDNQLTQVPTLSDYTQLDTVEQIWLDGNHIENFWWTDFPRNVKLIDLSRNELNMLPAMSEYDCCIQVSHLRLLHNKINRMIILVP